ncbi:MAG: hypothetical protein C0594_13220, partial [Marinilabiliales bacterium]
MEERKPTYQELEQKAKKLEQENFKLKNQQTEISKAKELYLNILTDFPALIWRSGLDKLCDYFNQTWLDFTGRTLDQELGNGWTEGVHPDDLDYCVQIYCDAFDKQEPFVMDYRLKNKLGEYRWIRDFGRPFYDLDNTFLGYVGSCYDITDNKEKQSILSKAKNKTEESEKKLADLVRDLKLAQNIANIGNWHLDPKVGVPVWSDFVYKIYERKPEDGLPHIDDYKKIYEPDQYSIFNKAITAAIKEGKHYDITLKLKLPGNKLKWIRAICVPDLENKSEAGYYLRGTIQDITEYKNTEAELNAAKEKAEEMNQRYNMAIQATSDGLWDWNLITNDVYYSPHWKSILGYTDKELENRFSVWEELTKDEDVKSTLKALDELVEGKRDSFEMEIQMRHKKGHWVTILSRADVFFNEENKAYRIVGTHTDISERKKAEEKLRQSEERFRKLIENMPSGVAIYKPVNNGKDFEFIDVNKEAEKITNSKKKDLIGHTLQEKFPNMINGPLVKNLRKIHKNGQEIYIPPFFYKDKQREGWRENYIYKLRSGEIVAIFKDVTQLKEAEENLKNKNKELITAKHKAEESEKRFKALHNASFGGIAIHDKGMILDCNQGLSDISGYAHDELIGMNGLLLIHESSRGLVLHNIKTGYEKPYEAIGQRKNGSKYPIRLEAREIPYKDKLVRVVEFRDITLQKKTEEELIEAKEKAEESDRLKTEFINNMSHEIRTPMNGIMGFTSLLNKENISDDKRKHYVNIIQNSGQQLMR